MQNDSSALVQIDPARTWERFVLVCVNWTQRECDMDQPASSELNLIPDFNLIPDPETGLALLAKCPAAETAEQALDRLFWHSQFTYWRNSLAGDRLAVAAAQMHCVLVKRLPPTWLCRAVHKLCMPDAQKRACDDLRKHVLRWQAVELVRGRHPNDPRNFKTIVQGDAVWEEAAKLVAGTYAEADAYTVRKSHALIRDAMIRRGNVMEVTVQSYKHAVETRDRPRRRKKS